MKMKANEKLGMGGWLVRGIGVLNCELLKRFIGHQSVHHFERVADGWLELCIFTWVNIQSLFLGWMMGKKSE